MSQAVTTESEEACGGTSVAWMPTSSAIVLVITAVRRRTDNGTDFKIGNPLRERGSTVVCDVAASLAHAAGD